MFPIKDTSRPACVVSQLKHPKKLSSPSKSVSGEILSSVPNKTYFNPRTDQALTPYFVQFSRCLTHDNEKTYLSFPKMSFTFLIGDLKKTASHYQD